MTLTKKYLMTYSEFLSTYCHCSADAVGNRPCDNGVLCDRCMTEEMQAIWKKIKEGLK